MNIYLDMVGCRLNQSEIETYARQFQAAGHTLVPTSEGADLAVINTCAVTAAAASDSRQKIRQAGRTVAGQVAVTGCWATLNPSAAAALPAVGQVISNSQKDGLVFDLLQISSETFDLEPLTRQPLPGARLRTRAFIKVQDGCDNRCTFCITTLARGASRSRSTDAVLADVRAARYEGGEQADDLSSTPAAQEIVLTGVHLGAWGKDFDPPLHLQDLIIAILEETDLPRLRLSSLEPWDLDEAFFSLWENPRLCRHLHLPLQSGCAATLRRMARKTTPESFTTLVKAARSAAPRIAITTDLIAGFPGESESEFEETLDFIRSINFAGGHVFTFSPRPGTAASRLAGQVPHPVRKARNAQLRGLLAESSRNYQRSFIGETLTVLWESATALGPQGWQLTGLSDNYLRVNALAPRRLWNRLTPVEVVSITGDCLVGVMNERMHIL